MAGIQPNALQGPDWGLEIAVPRNSRTEFLESILTGTIEYPGSNRYMNALLCAQPKSASLYIVQLLSLCLGFKNHQIGFDKARGGIYYPRLLAAKYADNDTISHCHAEPTPTVRKMIKLLGLRPLVLTRNLLDALVSRRDMLLRDRWASNMLSNKAIDTFVNGTSEYQLDVTIELFASSYINFREGWEQYRGDPEVRPIYMTYQELVDDEVGLVQRVSRELGLDVSPEIILDASATIGKAGGINLSTGVAGRGQEAFNERQLRTLRQKAAFLGCCDIDFLGFEV